MKYDPPRFEHDCRCCTYLGQFGAHDLYSCNRHGRIDTLIARYGNDGPDYVSGFEVIPYNRLMTEAFIRASGLGHYLPPATCASILRRVLIMNINSEEA